MISQTIDFLKKRGRAVKYIFFGIIVAIVAWSVLFVDNHHPHTWLENIPGFWSIFGFVSCIFLIFAASLVGKYGINRREDYYDS